MRRRDRRPVVQADDAAVRGFGQGSSASSSCACCIASPEVAGLLGHVRQLGQRLAQAIGAARALPAQPVGKLRPELHLHAAEHVAGIEQVVVHTLGRASARRSRPPVPCRTAASA